MMPDEDKIEFREVKPDEFEKDLLGGEYPIHDVEIIVKYKNGKEHRGKVGWDLIKTMYKLHGVSAVHEVYESILGNYSNL